MTVNRMVDQLRSFAREVTRVAREVGTEGKLGGQARRARRRRHVEGPHRQRQPAGEQPHRAGAQHRRGRRPRSRTATSRRRSPSTTQGEILELKNTVNTMVDQLYVVRRARSRASRRKSVPKASSAARPTCSGVSGTWKDLTDNVNVPRRQPDRAGARHRQGHDRGRERRPRRRRSRVDAQGEILELKNTINTMVDSAPIVRRGGHARREGSRHRRQARRPGRTCRASAAPGRTSPTT